jgi:IS4 transposase
VLVVDRFYNDFSLISEWDSSGGFFVVRHKETIQFKTIKENKLPENKHQYILTYEIVEFTGVQSKKKHKKRLRRVAIWNEENKQVEIITNQMSWTANTISELYKSRCQIEIFFKEIKQLLHIKSFIGTTENAVMIQICIALITILVFKALKAIAKYAWHLSNLFAFIRLNLFVKIDLNLWLNNPFETPFDSKNDKQIQGVLFLKAQK